MRNPLWLIRQTIVLAVAVVLPSCDVSPDQEAAMGAENARAINAQVPMVTDPAINEYLTALGDSIARNTSMGNLDWHFYVVDSHQVNAFSLPGGFVYVNRGLIENTDRLDELAGVLGHEIGHVVQRHSVKQMQSSQKIGIVATLACTLTNVCNNGLGQVAVNVGSSAIFAKHSRHDELQADSEAVENVLRVGIDPEGIPALFSVLIDQRKSEPTVVDGWFASHPLEESRIQNAKHLITTIGADQKGGLLQDTPTYHAFLDRVRSLPPPPRPPAGPDVGAGG